MQTFGFRVVTVTTFLYTSGNNYYTLTESVVWVLDCDVVNNALPKTYLALSNAKKEQIIIR